MIRVNIFVYDFAIGIAIFAIPCPRAITLLEILFVIRPSVGRTYTENMVRLLLNFIPIDSIVFVSDKAFQICTFDIWSLQFSSLLFKLRITLIICLISQSVLNILNSSNNSRTSAVLTAV